MDEIGFENLFKEITDVYFLQNKKNKSFFSSRQS